MASSDIVQSCRPSESYVGALAKTGNWDAFLEGCRRAYPTVSISPPSNGARQGRIRWRIFDDFSIAHVRTDNVVVDASARVAAQQGLADRYLLVWQLGGNACLENARGHTELLPSQAMIVPFSDSCRMHANEHYSALTLVFAVNHMPRWKGLAAELCGRPLMTDAAFNAAAAGIDSLLCNGGDARSASLVVDYAVDLVFRTLLEHTGIVPLTPSRAGARLEHARLLVQRHLEDVTYSPAQLADALGMSRRSLYEVFHQYGTTPARFIRQVRLENARSDVLSNGTDAPTMTEVALRNGFNDSASFSRAFRNAFGVTPSALRAAS
ncbi:MAG: hypothetical protein CMK99_15740 [Pseudomonas sp.]|nr:hypothetical protein [Pseudomonas sp.]HBS77189.1 hypothetical protein [Pseudomonas sp.]|tara:strand:- start:53796 stop:54764 length:969 start_codon:yes stop_codon:yes gene_type:complete